MHKIVVLDGYAANPGDIDWGGVSALGELTVYPRSALDEIAQRIGDADIVLTNKAPITRETLGRCPNLKYIGVLATGYNIVDVQAAKERGIAVANVPAYSTDSVAQMTFALLLEICHHVGSHSDAVHSGRWESCGDFCFWDYPLIELAGKTLGIVGLGSIGKAVARIARTFGMQVIAFSRTQTDAGREVAEYVDLDTLYARSDVISLHCPLFPETNGMINEQSIAKMKDGVIIINTGRGQLVVEQELADALNCGKVYAAAVDVVSAEPIRSENPLLKAKNCIITPHFSWAPKEARIRLMNVTVSNLTGFLNGKPENVVNK